MTAKLTPAQKIEWATGQRKEGNRLFASCEYQEAMDVYLTCLVAIDTSNSSTDAVENVDEAPVLASQYETEIKLPVLLNLALCALKLGMLSKAEKFCNYAIEMKAGKQSAKCYFRRGKVRMLMGHYISAELDLAKALDLLDQSANDAVDVNIELEKDKRVILREKQKLHQLVKQAEKNQMQQKKAMQRLFESDSSEGAKPVSTVGVTAEMPTHQNKPNDKPASLYPEKKAGTRKYSTLRDDPNWDHSIAAEDTDGEETSSPLRTYFEWYMQMAGRCAQKILDTIGGEDNELETMTASSSTLSSGDKKSHKID